MSDFDRPLRGDFSRPYGTVRFLDSYPSLKRRVFSAPRASESIAAFSAKASVGAKPLLLPLNAEVCSSSGSLPKLRLVLFSAPHEGAPVQARVRLKYGRSRRDRPGDSPPLQGADMAVAYFSSRAGGDLHDFLRVGPTAVSFRIARRGRKARNQRPSAPSRAGLFPGRGEELFSAPN